MAKKQPARAQRTYETRLKGLSSDEAALLDAYADLFGRVERHLFADWARGERITALKSAYHKCYGITARQFNAVRTEVEGAIDSDRAGRKERISSRRKSIEKAERVLAKLESRLENEPKTEKRHKLSYQLHHKKRRLQTERDRLARDEADDAAGKARICFGSRKRFRAQFHLEANGYSSHADWRADWHEARSGEFLVLGSKDETAGCQGCQARHLGGDRFAFRLRLPDALIVPSGGKYLTFEAALPYGAEHLKDSLEQGRAVSYRFKRDHKGWRLLVTTEPPAVEKQSDERLGVVGVDINTDHIAVAATDRHGNPVATRRIPLVLYGCTREQAKARIGEAVKVLMAFTAEQGKPLAVERLDFAAKRAQLEGRGARHSRMLSSFAYARVLGNIKARAHDRGIEVLERNPAYTSVIGAWKFAERYGISDHMAAALVIARRAMNLSERPNRRDHNALLLPARNRSRHVWSFWRQVSRRGAAHAARGRSAGDGRSRSPPARYAGQGAAGDRSVRCG